MHILDTIAATQSTSYTCKRSAHYAGSELWAVCVSVFIFPIFYDVNITANTRQCITNCHSLTSRLRLQFSGALCTRRTEKWKEMFVCVCSMLFSPVSVPKQSKLNSEGKTEIICSDHVHVKKCDGIFFHSVWTRWLHGDNIRRFAFRNSLEFGCALLLLGQCSEQQRRVLIKMHHAFSTIVHAESWNCCNRMFHSKLDVLQSKTDAELRTNAISI